MLRLGPLPYPRRHGQDVDDDILVLVTGKIGCVACVVGHVCLRQAGYDEGVGLDVEYLPVLGPGDVWLGVSGGPAEELHPAAETLQFCLGRLLEVRGTGARWQGREGGSHVGDAGLGQAQRVLCLAVVVTLVPSTGQTEVQLAVLLVRDLLDLLFRQSLHSQQLVVPVPVVGGGRVSVSSTLQHEPANISGDISV